MLSIELNVQESTPSDVSAENLDTTSNVANLGDDNKSEGVDFSEVLSEAKFQAIEDMEGCLQLDDRQLDADLADIDSDLLLPILDIEVDADMTAEIQALNLVVTTDVLVENMEETSDLLDNLAVVTSDLSDMNENNDDAQENTPLVALLQDSSNLQSDVEEVQPILAEHIEKIQEQESLVPMVDYELSKSEHLETVEETNKETLYESEYFKLNDKSLETIHDPDSEGSLIELAQESLVEEQHVATPLVSEESHEGEDDLDLEQSVKKNSKKIEFKNRYKSLGDSKFKEAKMHDKLGYNIDQAKSKGGTAELTELLAMQTKSEESNHSVTTAQAFGNAWFGTPNKSQGTDAYGLKQSLSLPMPVTDPSWESGLGEHVMMMTKGGIKQAQIHLNPPELGPLEVQVYLDNDTAKVSFSSSHLDTKALLETASSGLVELLQQEGLVSVEIDINQSKPELAGHSWSDSEHGDAKQERTNSKSIDSKPVEEVAPEVVRKYQLSNRIFDAYA